jgi:hypothetical protein
MYSSPRSIGRMRQFGCRARPSTSLQVPSYPEPSAPPLAPGGGQQREQPTAFVGQLAGPSSGPGCINRFRRDPSAETATTSKSGATSRNSVARTRNSTATAEKSVNPLDLQESLRSGTHCMTCDDPCRNTEETRPGPICRRWDEPHDRLRLWASRPADGVAEPETAAVEPDTEQLQGVRP